jgi:hypothetical protein
MGNCSGAPNDMSIDQYMSSKFYAFSTVLAYHPQKLKVDKTNYELNRKVSSQEVNTT